MNNSVNRSKPIWVGYRQHFLFQEIVIMMYSLKEYKRGLILFSFMKLKHFCSQALLANPSHPQPTPQVGCVQMCANCKSYQKANHIDIILNSSVNIDILQYCFPCVGVGGVLLRNHSLPSLPSKCTSCPL